MKAMLTNDGARVGRTAPPRATRRRLLDAAYELLVKEGYQATTLQGVARRAGLSTGAIYGHFANKQELMAAAVLDRWSYLQEEPAAVAAGGTWPDHPLVLHIARHLASPVEPIHQLLTEVTGAVLRDEGDAASPLLDSVRVLAWVMRASIDQAKIDGAIDERLSSDALTAVILDVYLGAITAKAWGLEQPDLADVVEVLSAINHGLANGS
jgi:AcrR family transcriptional regulator